MSGQRSSTAQLLTVAALYVETDGAYFGIDGVDPWDEIRDARTYTGPHPVVAHPPCNRWSIMALARPELKIGDDGGCFKCALADVRRFGGVLEHPAFTLAWRHFDLPRPPAYGWAQAIGDDGWVCQVDQGLYGHEMRKLTWLYAHGVELPDLRWGDGGNREKSVCNYGGGARQKKRSKTPTDFRDVLIGMARSVHASGAVDGYRSGSVPRVGSPASAGARSPGTRTRARSMSSGLILLTTCASTSSSSTTGSTSSK